MNSTTSPEKVLTEAYVADVKRRLEMHPIEFEERIPTLGKPLIIESACPGWQSTHWGPPEFYPVKPPGYKPGGIRYAAIPVSIEDQVKTDVEAIRAGAACLHHHPRDPETGISATMTPKHHPVLAEVYGQVFKQVDAITLEHTWFRQPDGSFDYIPDTQKLLELGKGNRYCQGAVTMWPPNHSYPRNYARVVQEGVKFMEANHVKPIHKLRCGYSVREMVRLLLDTGIMTHKPYVLVHDMGHPYGWPLDMDPWMPIDLVASIMQTKQRIPDSIIGVYSGGRNWLPITITAILMGVDIVRTGIEDTYWMYPHKDDVIQSNQEAVKKIVGFCNFIGRPIATVEQARQIMGIKLTSR